MKKGFGILTAFTFVLLLVIGLDAQQNSIADQTFPQGEKIMGCDVAPLGPDSVRQADVQSANPTETGLGIYRGVVIGQFRSGDSGQEIVCDFGASGVWVFDDWAWYQISGVNPDWLIAATLGDINNDEIIGDFGSLGLWMWSYGTYPGVWTQLSGVNPSWGFAVDDDNDTKQEIYVNFGAIGLWRWDNDGPTWRQASGLNALHGLRMDTIMYHYEEACMLFPSVGVWRIYTSGSSFAIEQLTGTVNSNDDHASARFTGGTAEDLILDFDTLGLWLLKENNHSWNLIINDSFDRIKTVQFGTNNPGLVTKSNYRTGLFYWRYAGAFPGIEVQINATSPDWYGFCEPFSYDFSDGDDELAVDMGASGLYVYEYISGTWTQLSAVNPVFMVAGDYWGDGKNTALLADFGTNGLWIYDGLFHTWNQISGVSPDDYSY